MISKWHQQDERHERIKQSQIIASQILTLECGECRLTKMAHHFYRDKSRKLGFSFRCIPCDRIRNGSKEKIVIMSDF